MRGRPSWWTVSCGFGLALNWATVASAHILFNRLPIFNIFATYHLAVLDLCNQISIIKQTKIQTYWV